MKALIIIGILAFIVIAFTIACVIMVNNAVDFDPEIDLEEDEPTTKDIQPTKPPIIPPKK